MKRHLDTTSMTHFRTDVMEGSTAARLIGQDPIEGIGAENEVSTRCSI